MCGSYDHDYYYGFDIETQLGAKFQVHFLLRFTRCVVRLKATAVASRERNVLLANDIWYC